MKVSHRTGNKSPSSAGPSIWWLLGMALAAVVMVWGSYELVQEASLQPVVLLLLLALVGLPLMVMRRQWWRPQRRGIHPAVVYALLGAGLAYTLLGGLLDALLSQQIPRLFFYPTLLALGGILFLMGRPSGDKR